MIFQYALKIPECLEEDLQDVLKQMISEERKEKLERYHFEADKKRGLFAEILLRYGLGKDLGIKQDDILFETNEYGKPKLIKQENIFFNFSHSGDWVVCAIGDEPLGVDVEQIKGKDLEIAKRFYTEYEYEELLRQKEEKRPECFIKYWTLKESYTKAEGKGLSIPFTTFGFRFTQDDVVLYIGEEPSKEYFLYVYKIDEGYEAAVCAHDPDVKEFNEITLEQIKEFFHV